MVANSSQLPPREVHKRLLQALADLEMAQKNAVVLFDEVVRRRLYRDFGYSSIYQYAELELGFKKSKTAQFLRLTESLKELPELRRSVVRGELSWTKAREVAKVATPQTEAGWIETAKSAPRRVLETRVAEARREARVGASGRAQVTLEMGGGEKGGCAVLEERKAGEAPDPATPVDVHVRMTAGQYARYQALMETLAKGGAVGDKAERILAGLEQLALGVRAAKDWKAAVVKSNGKGQGRPEEVTRVNSPTAAGQDELRFTRVSARSPYQVVVQMCPRCERGSAPTSRGEKTLEPGELRSILCDATTRRPGERNKAAIPERLRRAVLERDRFRCRSAGCGRSSFLAVHHRVPREAGGKNTLENLITLCSGCHRAVHG